MAPTKPWTCWVRLLELDKLDEFMAGRKSLETLFTEETSRLTEVIGSLAAKLYFSVLRCGGLRRETPTLDNRGRFRITLVEGKPGPALGFVENRTTFVENGLRTRIPAQIR